MDIVQGCFFLTKRDLWDQLGGLDESFFMYGEEADYCLKSIQMGYQPTITPAAKIIHHGGASEPTFSGKMIKLLKGKVELINRHSRKWEKPLHRMLLSFYVMNKTFSAIIFSIIKSNTEDKKTKALEWQKVMQAQSSWSKGWDNEKWPR